jgi:hypothetical protein
MEKKERIREEEEFVGTERFITGSYKAQLELNKQNDILGEHEENYNKKRTANSETGMMGFYKNFLTKNSAMGGGMRDDVFKEFNETKDDRKDGIDKIQEALNQKEDAVEKSRMEEIKRK